MALMLHDNYTARFGLICSAAAAEVALLLGFNEKTIRIWRRDFLRESFLSIGEGLMFVMLFYRIKSTAT